MAGLTPRRMTSLLSAVLAKHAAPIHPGTGTDQSVHGGGGGKSSDQTSKFDRFVHRSNGGKTTEVDAREVFMGADEAGIDVDRSSMVRLRDGTLVPSFVTSPSLGRPELPEGEFWVIDRFQEQLDAKIQRLGRKAERLGYDPLRLTPTGRTHRWTDAFGAHGPQGGIIEQSSFRLDGEQPLIPGYDFVARIEHIKGPDGYTNLLKKNPHYEGDIPAKYRDIGPNCDRCKRNIYRRDTFIVRNQETGEFAQLGRDDLQAYVGNDKADQMFQYGTLWLEDFDRFSEIGDSEGGGGRREAYLGTRGFLAASVAAVEERGRYVKVSDEGESTKDRVLRHAFARKSEDYLDITDAHYEKADKIMEWVDDLEVGDSDYLWNLKVALSQSGVDRRTFGVAASAVAAYTREQERSLMLDSLDSDDQEGPSFVSDFVGTPKERMRGLELTVTRTHSFDGQYGTTFIYNMRDDSGNSFVWFSSNPLQYKDPEAVARVAAEDRDLLLAGQKIFEEKMVPAGVTYEGLLDAFGHTAGMPELVEAKRLKEAGKLTPEMSEAADVAIRGKLRGVGDRDVTTALLYDPSDWNALTVQRNQLGAYIHERLRQGGTLDLDKFEGFERNEAYTIANVGPGDKIKLDATVKEHKLDTFGGANEKQTVLTRGKMIDYLGKVEVDERGMPKSLGRRGKGKLALPYTVQEYTGRWGRAYIPLPDRKPNTPVTFKRRIRDRHWSGFEIEFTNDEGELQTYRVEDAEVDIPIEMLAKRDRVSHLLAHRAEVNKLLSAILAKHGTTHDESSHGNWARGISSPQLAAEAKEGGFTVSESGHRPTSGFVVATPGAERRIPVDQLTPDTISAYRKEFAERLAQPDTYLGAWYDTESGDVFLDVSKVYEDRDEAIEYGRSSNQLAIFDLSTFTEIRLDDLTPIAARRVPLALWRES